MIYIFSYLMLSSVPFPYLLFSSLLFSSLLFSSLLFSSLPLGFQNLPNGIQPESTPRHRISGWEIPICRHGQQQLRARCRGIRYPPCFARYRNCPVNSDLAGSCYGAGAPFKASPGGKQSSIPLAVWMTDEG